MLAYSLTAIVDFMCPLGMRLSYLAKYYSKYIYKGILDEINI